MWANAPPPAKWLARLLKPFKRPQDRLPERGGEALLPSGLGTGHGQIAEGGRGTRCTGCGECCRETEMLLSAADIARLRRLGYRPSEFTVKGPEGLARLRNLDGWCYFYDREAARCRVYEHRPVGCSAYPIIFSMEEGVIVDELCPQRDTVSREELEAQGRIVVQHVAAILREARARRHPT